MIDNKFKTGDYVYIKLDSKSIKWTAVHITNVRIDSVDKEVIFDYITIRTSDPPLYNEAIGKSSLFHLGSMYYRGGQVLNIESDDEIDSALLAHML